MKSEMLSQFRRRETTDWDVESRMHLSLSYTLRWQKQWPWIIYEGGNYRRRKFPVKVLGFCGCCSHEAPLLSFNSCWKIRAIEILWIINHFYVFALCTDAIFILTLREDFRTDERTYWDGSFKVSHLLYFKVQFISGESSWVLGYFSTLVLTYI